MPQVTGPPTSEPRPSPPTAPEPGSCPSPRAPGLWGPRGHRLQQGSRLPPPPCPQGRGAGDVGARPPGGVRQAPVCLLSAGSGPAGTRCHLIPGQEMAAGPRQENGGLPRLPPGDLGPTDGTDGSSIRNPRPEPPLCPRVLLRLKPSGVTRVQRRPGLSAFSQGLCLTDAVPTLTTDSPGPARSEEPREVEPGGGAAAEPGCPLAFSKGNCPRLASEVSPSSAPVPSSDGLPFGG